MLTVHATLQPDGRVQLPRALAQDKPAPVLVTILEPRPDGKDAAVPAPHATGAGDSLKGDVANLLAMLGSP